MGLVLIILIAILMASLLLLGILAIIQFVLFKYLPSKYGFKYASSDQIAIDFLPTEEIIIKTISEDIGNKAKEKLHKLLKLNRIINSIKILNIILFTAIMVCQIILINII